MVTNFTKALTFCATSFVFAQLNAQNTPQTFTSNGKIGLKKAGKVITEPKFDVIKEYKGKYALVQLNSKVGIIDTNGVLIIPTVYEEIEYDYLVKVGYARFKQDGKFGFINKNGKVKVKNDYDVLENYFKEGMAYAKKGAKWSFISDKGVVVASDFDSTDTKMAYMEGVIPVMKDGKWGAIDKLGKLLIPANFDFVHNLREHLLVVKKGSKFAFYNKKGTALTDFIYDEVDYRANNYHLVSATNNGKKIMFSELKHELGIK